MKIAVINEVSCCSRNGDIINALRETTDAEILNVGMTGAEGETELTYINTAYMAAILLNTGAVDMVVAGCGTGQGFLNAVVQFPKIICGLIIDPLDAFLFSQINVGNCISLPLNKGYGWAGDVNLKYVFEKLFSAPAGGGYPPHRAKSQGESREILARISKIAHFDMKEIVKNSDKDILRKLAACSGFMKALEPVDTEMYQLIRTA